MSIEVRGVTKRFNSFVAVENVDLDVAAGEFVALLGPSGSGKTTLLRLIAGLDAPDRGSIRFNGVDAVERSVKDRRVGFVFQHYALFRHMSVFENVAFGLRVQPRKTRPSEAQIRKKVDDLLELVQLDRAGDRYPSQLSGGQRQRVALARALAVEPRVLLLDEPFGALDAKVRKDLRRSLRRLHEELHVTSVFVTHDQEEALELADRVAIINQGRVEQIGTPQEVYDRPASPFVYRFLGDVNLFHSRVEEGLAYIGHVPIEVPSMKGASAQSASVYVRPHALEIRATRDHARQFRARVLHINPAGPTVKLDLLTEWGAPILVEMPQERFRALGLQNTADVFVNPVASEVFVHAD
jgi:sulfate/thiosulfate transport system ATP-binding protein